MVLGWNPALLSAVQLDGTLNQPGPPDRSYALEIAIPFAEMTGRGRRPPEPGDCWRANLYRVDRSIGVEALSAWRATHGDFHALSTYGNLCFSR